SQSPASISSILPTQRRAWSRASRWRVWWQWQWQRRARLPPPNPPAECAREITRTTPCRLLRIRPQQASVTHERSAHARAELAATGAIRALVRWPRLDSARASARTAGESPRWPFGAADRTDRSGQDVGGISAESGGIERAVPPLDRSRCRRRKNGKAPDLDRPRHSPRGRPAYALYLAAESARGRHRAQLGAPGGRDGAGDPHRDPHRRHAAFQASAPPPRPAADPAHHAGTARADPRVPRCALSLWLAQASCPRRAARAGHVEARRSALTRLGTAVYARSRPHQRRSFGNRGGAGRPATLPRTAARAWSGNGRSGRSRRRRCT